MVFYDEVTSITWRKELAYKFIVYSIHPPKYSEEFYRLLSNARKEGRFTYKPMNHDNASPPGFVKEIITITASNLTIIEILHKFAETIKTKKGKVYINVQGKTIDIEAHNIEELKEKISK